MATITIVMHIQGRVGDHVIHPTFQRENASLRKHVSWDEIQNWVAAGHEVTIRPPTDEETKAFQSRP